MTIKITFPLVVVFIAMLLTPILSAQDLSESSTAVSAGSDPALGAEGQELTDSVPELKQVDRKRDTKSRGDFVGADSGDAGFFGGESQSGDSRDGSRRMQRPRSRESYQPGGLRSQPGRSRGTTLRPRLALGFPYTPKPSPRLAENVRACLQRIPSLSKNSSIRVSVENNVVVLAGTVANAHDRALSEQLVALAPGVNKIDNRLKVADADSPGPETGR